MPPMFAAMLRALILSLFLPAAAMAETFAFDVTLAGVKVATMVVEGDERGGGYRVTAAVATRGLAGALRPVRWDAAAEGRVKGGRLLPAAYREEISTGRRESSVRMAWQGGVPQVLAQGEEGPQTAAWVDPASQKGTVDPLTTLFAGLRAAGVCDLSLQVFDGRRRSAVTLYGAKPDEGGVRCRGKYRRLQGFTPEEMAERPGFAFEVLYLPGPDGALRVARIETDTLFGRAVLRRR